MKINNLQLIFLIVLITGCSINPVSGNRDFVLMNEDQEISMGQKYSAQVLQQVPAYKDKKLQDYVQRIGQSLSEKSHRSNLIYRFIVLDNPDINAFALPGGYIFINRGLMAYLSSEEELAAVLGHELGHVTARHSVRQMSQAQLMNFMSVIVGAQAGRTAGDIANLAGGAFLAGYGRDMELEADEIGAKYMSLDGYSTQGMFKTLSVLKEQEVYATKTAKDRGLEPRTYHGVFASHPSNDKRLQEILLKTEQTSSELKEPQGQYLELVNGMVYGDSQEEGIRRGNYFYHGPLNIYLKAPEVWEIVNSQNGLSFKSRNNEATLFFSMEDQNRKITPKEYLERNKAFKILNGRPVKGEGFEGYTVEATRSGIPYRLGAVFRGNSIYQFYGMVKERTSFNKYDPNFLSIIDSFRGLKSDEEILSKPLRLHTYIVKKGDSYGSLAKQSFIPFDPEGRLRLLNGHYPDGSLIIGETIKIIK